MFQIVDVYNSHFLCLYKYEQMQNQAFITVKTMHLTEVN